jgi:hypothetical protein
MYVRLCVTVILMVQLYLRYVMCGRAGGYDFGGAAVVLNRLDSGVLPPFVNMRCFRLVK